MKKKPASYQYLPKIIQWIFAVPTYILYKTLTYFYSDGIPLIRAYFWECAASSRGK